MTPFKLGEEDFNIPAGYHELTIAQFRALRNLKRENDLWEIVSILSGIEYSKWFSAVMNEVEYQRLLLAIEWAKTPIDFNKLPLPEKITISGRDFPVHKDLSVKPTAAYFEFKDKIAAAYNLQQDLTPHLHTVIAMYYQQDYFGVKEYSSDDRAEFEKLCDSVPAMQAVPVATFFLKKILGLQNLKGNIYSTSRRQKSSRQGSKTLAN